MGVAEGEGLGETDTERDETIPVPPRNVRSSML